MAGSDNLKGKGFDSRSTEELREIARKGGRASGEARRRKADFRKTLNLLLTAEIDSEEWTPVLESLGLESTLESAVNMAMIKEALSGNVKAYVAIKDVIGQTSKSNEDLEEQKVRVSSMKAKMEDENAEEEQEDDGFLDALKGSAGEDWGDLDEEEETDI